MYRIPDHDKAPCNLLTPVLLVRTVPMGAVTVNHVVEISTRLIDIRHKQTLRTPHVVLSLAKHLYLQDR